MSRVECPTLNPCTVHILEISAVRFILVLEESFSLINITVAFALLKAHNKSVTV